MYCMLFDVMPSFFLEMVLETICRKTIEPWEK